MALTLVSEGKTNDKVIGFGTDCFIIGYGYLELMILLLVLLSETNDNVIGMGRSRILCHS